MNIFDLNNDPEDNEEDKDSFLPSLHSLSDKDNVPYSLIEEGQTNALARRAQKAGIDISTSDAAELAAFMKESRFGHQASLTMICYGSKCQFHEICPLVRIGAELPLNKQCPVESSLVDQWVSMYMESLQLDPEDPANAIEVHMVYELAGLELIRRRAANDLSKHPELIRNEVVGYSPQGHPIYDDKPSQGLLILERHSKIVNKLRESLLATPKAAAQAGQISSDLSIRTANIANKAKEIAKARRGGKSIADVNFSVVDDESSKDKTDPQK